MRSLPPEPGSIRHIRDIPFVVRQAGWPGVAAAGAVGVWGIFLGALWTRHLHLSSTIYRGALFAAPVAFTIAAAVAPLGDGRSVLTLLAAGAALASGSILGAQLVAFSPALVYIIAGFALAYIAVRRWPGPTVIALFAISAAYGTLRAYASFLHPGLVVTALLTALTVTTAVVRMRRRGESWRAPLGVVLVVLYVAVSVVEITVGPNTLVAVRQFLVSGWFMLAFLAISYRGWTIEWFRRISRIILVVSAGVGAYAALRWVIGPSGAESRLLAGAGAFAFTVSGPGGARVIGSLPNGPALGFWTATALPFCLAAVLFGSRRMRWFAVTLPLLVVGLLGSGSRASLIAASLGVLLVLVLALIARADPGQRVAMIGGTVAAVVVCAAALFPAVIADNPAKVARYANILTPRNDASFADRIDKWQGVIADVSSHPVGFGFGSASPGPRAVRFPSATADNVDSAYIQVAYEQGIAVMILYILALFALLIGLARRAHATYDRERAGIGIGAAGTLLAFMVVCVAGQFQFDVVATGVWIIVGLGVAAFARGSASVDSDVRTVAVAPHRTPATVT